jgi:hypothetical protein
LIFYNGKSISAVFGDTGVLPGTTKRKLGEASVKVAQLLGIPGWTFPDENLIERIIGLNDALKTNSEAAGDQSAQTEALLV